MTIVGVICARGGSKGIPRKNLRMLKGQPLVAYAIKVAKASKYINKVIVSTEDEEIAEVAQEYGTEVLHRPLGLALDNTPELEVWKHVVKNMDMDIFVSIPPTSPLRSVEDVDKCIQMFIESDADIVIAVREAVRNPYFNMVSIDKHGCAHLVIPSDAYQRQNAPEVFDITTICYVAQPEYILKTDSILRGKVRTVLVPYERSIDIDTEVDLKIAEDLLRD